MANYFVGDIHGCYRELIKLLDKVNFKFGSDILWITGDMLLRGPESVKVLRYIKNLGNSSRIVLGNHEITTINLFYNFFKKKSIFCFKKEGEKNKDYYTDVQKIFLENDSEDLMDWLKNQSILQMDMKKKIIMIHAGVHPYWNLEETISYAKEIEFILQNKTDLLQNLVGFNHSYKWEKRKFKDLYERIKFNINVFTKMRYCYQDGSLNMSIKDDYQKIKNQDHIRPWFLFDRKISQKYSIIFGHWSSLDKRCVQKNKNLYPIDTGCCWGKKLTILRWEDRKHFDEPCRRRKTPS
ncbi:symmetrical bis(5'-nucleosyl)-tetraphosphatase [Candidatus Riesia pediculicola]|uniref:bis(5'-nucleosyl)-tetraphosphatase (symmetrical) n=1 Tax=Riesia pediculicola (strain USDA) TaxID=515618 RepID=D4G8G4_RIEPU|nr:symmetrical bis(5'-nucleosyl)-tetraphosphatase [Candidatus Riesia pediculicola]ADD79665.1 bis(5'-nucleosyl)-tetraphosphatase (symmetrical) [Candidatus Riesia pediculicola USDA]ARC53848.1 hypothetical protein AOE55_01655 [Candidatus Riesia pediculicola]QOJ86480.1 symmetrical bis(5'-nucleosyl)-tetraphosphatase [Candidatus Riesia pediculicola]